MNDDEFMYVLEAMAYISATIAAFVYVWETCTPAKKQIKKVGSNSNLIKHGNISKNRRSSSSLYDDFQ